MDLGAYSDMGRLEGIVKESGIEIPRERGYRLMSEQNRISQDDYEKAIKDISAWLCEQLIQASQKYSIHYDCQTFSPTTEKQVKKFIKDGEIQWNLIHGKFRKNLKYVIKKNTGAIKTQYDTFNKYAGRSGVVMVHARVGSDNWEYFDCHHKVDGQPWFIEKVDDCFDPTYCDVYCKVKSA